MRSIGIFCRTLIMLAETLFLGLVCWVASMMLSVTEFMGPLFDPSAWYRLAALERSALPQPPMEQLSLFDPA